MKRPPFLKLLLLLLFITLAIFIYSTSFEVNNSVVNKNEILRLNQTRKQFKDIVRRKYHISFVVCESRYKESINVVKSVLIFTKTPVSFVIFTDDILWDKLNETLSEWKSLAHNQMEFDLHKITFPKEYEDDWLNLFSKCAAQRLFIPNLVPNIDSMIYVDTDTLFLGPVDELWQYFNKFNGSQISAMTLEDDNPNVSWYPRFAKHPFYGKFGLNSGVMLMNLTRMREFGWVDYVTPIMLKWKLCIPWGDQDIINIIFHYHPTAVHVLPCRYNYRSDQCMYGDACADATRQGVFLIHGSRGAFHNHKHPAFEAVYQAVDEHNLHKDSQNVFLERLERYLSQVPNTSCGSLKEAFLKVPAAVVNSTKILR